MAETGAPPQVVATAGHVDHGKSSLILRLTGIDPDRLAEEKRRGLTIDLGFAWATLPSGREVGFVDVPGHERFIRNMLAGVGPVRQVLFVVAADEGWKPQSEEHLQIVDVLGVDGAVVALTKVDLVDEATLAARIGDLRERLKGTRLEEAAVVPCSAQTGQGFDELVGALEDMLVSAPSPEADGRPRQFLDRVFTIRGSGTVVTGTLTGGPIAVGWEAQILPSGHRARIRGLQTHKRALQVARPVSRVAVNLVGTPKDELERGEVLVLPDQWRPTSSFDALVRPVRSLGHPLTSRGAYKLYVGSAEVDVRLGFATETKELPVGGQAFARVTTRRPVVLDLHDRFVLREAGRRETVAGGLVLDVDPPARPHGRRGDLLAARLETQDRGAWAMQLLHERGFVRSADVLPLTGAAVDAAMSKGAIRIGSWLTTADRLERAATPLIAGLQRYHSDHPLREGMGLAEARALIGEAGGDPSLADAILDRLVATGLLARAGTSVRLPEYRATTAGRDDAGQLVATVSEGEPSPPTIRELGEHGFGLELVKAVVAEGRLVRISPDLVVTPEFLTEAERVVRARGHSPGITVSDFRQALGTSRKYALPILEYFDAKGLTRRMGDHRVVQG